MLTTILAAALAAATMSAAAQGGQSGTQAAQQARVTVPGVTVTAQKEPADAQRLPLSVTPLTWEALESAGITLIKDAELFSPNTYVQELSARKISNPRIRGIGSSPANPGITTYIDGVPQLNTNSSSVELIDVEQIEFVRGPQSGLYGRNTLGGLVNITSVRPSITDWHGAVSVPLGNFGAREVRANVSGPVTPAVGASVAFGYAGRDGFTTNSITGNDIDSRSALFGKGQLYFTPSSSWEARLIVSGERARDGDYALQDLGSLRANEFTTARDYEGESERDIFNTTFIARRTGGRFSFTSTTGIVRWTSHDDTDLDYTPLPLIGRVNDEESLQFTQELRLASSSPLTLAEGVGLRWQIGGMLFTQGYEQEAVNSYSPGVLSPFVLFPVRNTSPLAQLDDLGLGAYAQGTFSFGDRVELTAGARFDHEKKEADLRTSFDPAIAPASALAADETYTNVSPQVALSFHARPGTMLYVSGGGGYKAGGFNPTSLPGSEAYGDEHTRHIEGGVKTTWAGNRATLNASAFFIDWTDMQLNVPIPNGGGAFFISNVGAATSKGVEVELGLRPASGIDLFGSLGLTRAEFGDGSLAMGISVDGNQVPGTPEYTALAGGQLTRQIVRSWAWFVRGEAAFYGSFQYDEANTAMQDAYSLVNFRGGVTGRRYSVVAWVKNAFDEFYVPVAFAYPGLAPSGFVGEPGRPRTFGITFGARF
jgi:iron complex outermembrane receptor protein